MEKPILIIFSCFMFSSLGLLSQNKPCNKEDTSNNILKVDSTVTNTLAAKHITFNGVDGPYVINDTLYRVDANNKLIKEIKVKNDSIRVQVSNEFADQFYVSIKAKDEILKSTYAQPEKLIAISDIEGNYNAFASFLMQNEIVDNNHDWIFGNGHLVLLGDFVDRGVNVRAVLWLIYKMEQQAKEKNGQVHFILGNHEVLNFHGDHRYNKGKYIKVAKEISGFEEKTSALKFVYSDQSKIGKWLATKNVVEKIGDYLFVHGGLHPEILDYQLTIDSINSKVRSGYNTNLKIKDKIADFLYSGKGPFWYRGLVMSRSEYDKLKEDDLNPILSYYNAKKIVVGHTPVKNISTDFTKRVIRLDVAHGPKKSSGKTKGLFIEDGVEYIIDDIGTKIVLN